MTDMEPEHPGPLLKHMRAQNDALRWEIVREIAHMNHSDLQAVLRMIAVWKGRAVQPDAVSRDAVLDILSDEGWLGDSLRRISALPAVQPHVNETPKSEHDARDVLTPATKGGDA